MTDFKTNISGRLEQEIKCPSCGWIGLVYYTTQVPKYCSPACKQKAYRQRVKRNAFTVTHYPFREWQELGLQNHQRELMKIVDDFGIKAAQATTQLIVKIATEIKRDNLKRLGL